MKRKISIICLLCCFYFGACNKTPTKALQPTPPYTSDSTETGTPPQEDEGENDDGYILQFTLSVEMDGNIFYLAVDGLSKAGEETPSIHTVESKIIKVGEKLTCLKSPTILNDKTSRYIFSHWEVTDGECVITVTADTVLSETSLRLGNVTVRPVIKKVKHTGNYS